MSRVTLGTGMSQIVIEMAFGRKLINSILTIYVPTALLICIMYATNFFKDFFFEAVVTVNLTGMLVLTTIFMTVSSNLPQTSYVKMIDIWLLFCILVPFIEVLLHTWMDLHRKEDRDINHHGRSVRVGSVGSVKRIDLIARRENIQVNALRKLYEEAQYEMNYLKVGEFLGKIAIPISIILFSASYWIYGLLH